MFLNILATFLSYHIWRPFCSHHSQVKRAIRYTSCRKSPTVLSRYRRMPLVSNLRPVYTCKLPSLGKVRQTWICIAPRREHTSKALRYGTRSQGISQFHLHTPGTSANGMNHTCLCLPSRSWSSFTDPGWMVGCVGLGARASSPPNYAPG